jgi:putative membrane protein
MWTLTGLLSGVSSGACIADAGDFRALALSAIAGTAGWYALGVIRLRARLAPGSIVGPARIAAMAAGLSMLAVALASPLDALAGGMLSAHMLQHLLVMLIASPLIVWGLPLPVFRLALPGVSRKPFVSLRMSCAFGRLADLVRRPTTAWLLFSGSIALWHLPVVYRWALSGGGSHALMHLTFLAAGLLFWSVVLEPSGRKRRLDHGGAMLFVFSTALATGLPGALLSFASKPIYLEPLGSFDPLGLSPLQDQRLAGLIMWIPMDFVLFAVAGALFAACLEERAARTVDCRAAGS